jgi:catecholate siderophore receptor
MKKITRKHGVALLAIALANFNLSAQDGGATTELNPLNVIGSKGEAPTLSSGLKSSLPVSSSPESISIIGSEQIKQQGLKGISDVLDFTPGVTNSQGEGHRDAPVIRGVRTTQDLYRDGIRDDVQYYRPLYNIEQVEVLRGPNAIRSGFGGAYGIINRVTKKGVIGEDFTVLSGSVDTFGETNVQLDRNMQLNENSSLRVNIFGENLSNHRDFYYGDGFGVNPTLRYDLGDGSTLDVSYEYLNQERFIDRGIPTANNKPDESLKDYVFGDPTENFSTHTAHIMSAVYQHELSDSLYGRLSASHSDHDKLYQNFYATGITANTVTLDGYVDTTNRQTSTLSYEVSGEFETGGIIHNIIAGIEYLDMSNDNDRYNALWTTTNDDNVVLSLTRPLNLSGGVGVDSAGNPTANQYTGINRDRQDTTFADIDVLSFYLMDEIEIMEKLTAVAGVRFDNMDIDIKGYDAKLDLDPGVAATAAAGIDPNGDASGSDSDEMLSPRLGLIFDLTDEASLYASYSETFSPKGGDQYARLKGYNDDNTSAGYGKPLDSRYDPDTFENVEFGFKYDFANGLSLSASYFEIEAEKPTPSSNGETLSISSSEISGFELQLLGMISDKWFINAAYTNLDAHENDGDRLREAPENTFSVWNNYLLSDRFAVNFGILHQGETHISNGSAEMLPEFTRVDAGASYLLTENTRIQLNVENLTDELYFPHAHGTHQASVAAPINAMLSITSSF